jgi:hypothetical protein
MPGTKRDITIQVEVSDGFLSDVMVVMIETPMTLWSWDNVSVVNIDRQPDLSITSFIIECDDPNVERSARFTMDADRVVEGIVKILDNDSEISIDPTIRNYIVRGVMDNDAGEIDAIAADCIMQAAFFNALVYG